MNKNKGVRVLPLFLAVFFLLTGCGKGLSKPGSVDVKVAFWGSLEEIAIIRDSFKEWQEANSQINVIFEHTPYTGYDSKVLTRIAGGAAPDIIATTVDHFVTFASKDVLLDLKPLIEADTTGFALADFFPEIVDRFTINGKTYAIPRDVAPFACVYYNKKLFDEEGLPYPRDNWTWEEFLETARRLTKKYDSGRVKQYGFYTWAWQNFIYGNGGALVDNVAKPTRTLLDEPQAIEGLQFYADMINLYHVMPTPVALANLDTGIDLLFSSGRIAMFLSGIWDTPSLKRYDFNWDVAMFPKNSKGIRAFGSGGTGYAILKSSKHKKEAWQVVKAMTDVKGQGQLARQGLAQPSRILVARGNDFAKNNTTPANKRMLNEAVKHSIFSPFHPRWREIEDKYLVPRLDLVFNGKKSAAEVLKEIAPRINALLQNREN